MLKVRLEKKMIIIRHIALCAIISALTFTTGCSMLEKVTYHQEIVQGNFLRKEDIKKVHIGMTKKQVIYILGTPIITDLFNNNWYYISRSIFGKKKIIQQTVKLIFNDKVLIYINSKSYNK